MLHYCNRVFPFARPVLKRAFSCQQCGQMQASRNLWDMTRSSDFRNMVKEMDRTMETLERNFFNRLPFWRASPRLIPIQGLMQRQGETYRVNVDVEGFKPEELNVALKDHMLIIKGKMERKAEDGSKHYEEFTRELSIPENVDPTSLKSFLTNDGLLSIEAPYISEEKPKEIPVSRD